MTFEELSKIIGKHSKVNRLEFSMESDLFGDFGLDSVDLLDIVVAIEELIGKQFSETELDIEKFRTMGSILNLVNNRSLGAISG